MSHNIWKYYFLNSVTRRVVTPIIVVFIKSHGLSVTRIGTILALGTLTAFILQIPGGILADRIGHKSAIAISFLIKTFSMVLYVAGDTFGFFLAGTMMFWGANALWTDTNKAFLWETLKDMNSSPAYKKVYGTMMLISQTVSAALLVIIPIIYVKNHNIVFWINSSLFFTAFLISLTLTQPTWHKNVGLHKGPKRLLADIKRIIAYLRSHPSFARYMLFVSLWDGLQDALEEFQQLFFQAIKLPTKLFGVVYGANRLLQGVGAYIAHLTEKVITQIRFIKALTWVLPAFSFGIAWVHSTVLGSVLFPVRNLVAGYMLPFNNSFYHKEITEGDRVVLISLGGCVSTLVKAGGTFILGYMLDRYALSTVFTTFGITTILIFAPLYFWTRTALNRLATREI